MPSWKIDRLSLKKHRSEGASGYLLLACVSVRSGLSACPSTRLCANARNTLEHGFLLLLVIVSTIAFSWLISPFVGAILWSVIAAILFAPLNMRLLRAKPMRRNLAALITLLVIVALVIIPAMLLGAALLNEASSAYARVQTGDIDLGRSFIEAERHLPQFARHWLSDLGYYF